jgi:hypothetical protein
MICPDGGTCHHACDEGSTCWRSTSCMPLSAYGDRWPTPAPAGAFVPPPLRLRDLFDMKEGTDSFNGRTAKGRARRS